MTLYFDLIAKNIYTKICVAKLQSVLDGQKRETNHYIVYNSVRDRFSLVIRC